MITSPIERAGYFTQTSDTATDVEYRGNPKRLRRFVAKGLAAVSLFGVTNTGLETYYMNERPTQTTISFKNFITNLESMRLLPHTYWVVFPGAAVDFSASVESELAPVMHQYGQTFTVQPSPVKIDPEEIARKISEQVNPENRYGETPIKVRFYGISMGGMLAWQVGKVLEKSYPNIQVEAIIFDSSPSGTGDVNRTSQPFVKASAFVDEMPNLPFDIPNPLKGGPLSRLAISSLDLANKNFQNGEWPLSFSDIQSNWRLATGVSSNYFSEQMKIIDTFDTTPDSQSLPHAKFAYFGAAGEMRDEVVQVNTSIDGYQRLIGNRHLEVYKMSETFHASANTTPAPYLRSLRDFIRKCGFESKNDVRNKMLATSITNAIKTLDKIGRMLSFH